MVKKFPKKQKFKNFAIFCQIYLISEDFDKCSGFVPVPGPELACSDPVFET